MWKIKLIIKSIISRYIMIKIMKNKLIYDLNVSNCCLCGFIILLFYVSEPRKDLRNFFLNQN